MEYLTRTQVLKPVASSSHLKPYAFYFSLCLFCEGCGRGRRWIKVYLRLRCRRLCLTETSCVFSAEQEDPRLRIPVQQRRRGSLDPNDLGPLPVRSPIVLSPPCACFLKDNGILCLARSHLTVLQNVVKGLRHLVFFKRSRLHVFPCSLVGRRGSTAMGGYSTLITVRRNPEAKNLKRKTIFTVINIQMIFGVCVCVCFNPQIPKTHNGMIPDYKTQP